MMTTAWSASSAAPRSETASTWMLATALSSSSRTAGSLTAGSTFTTSTLGTSSGLSPAGAAPQVVRQFAARAAGRSASRSSVFTQRYTAQEQNPDQLVLVDLATEREA